MFIKENLYQSKRDNQMLGHKLGEFSNKEIGAKIIYRKKRKSRKIKENSESCVQCDILNSVRISIKWIIHG
jgi:hypothetical protein